MVSALAAVTAMVGVIALYQVLSDLFLRDRSRTNDRVDYEFLKQRKDQAKKSPLFKNLGQVAAEAAEGEGKRPSLRNRFHAMVEQSGLDITPDRLAALSAISALGLGLLVLILRRHAVEGLIALVLGGVAPIWYVNRKRKTRIEKLRSQLSEAFELMARVVRAGQTLGQALLAVADEFPQPIAGEFAYCYEQQNLGLPPEVAFRDLNRRTGVIELKIFVLAVLVQQQTGGNLAELLLKLSAVVKDRYLIRGTINTLTAEGRMQGWILAGLPPIMLLFITTMNGKYAAVLFAHPNILIMTFFIELLGVLWIRKIVNFDF
jgi:tight adherence protein B